MLQPPVVVTPLLDPVAHHVPIVAAEAAEEAPVLRLDVELARWAESEEASRAS